MTVRESVSLGLFAIAVLIAASFVLGFPSQTNGAQPSISLGVDPPTPTATATPTPLPATLLGEPGETWLVSFFAIRDDGVRNTRSTVAQTGLDFDFDGPPFGDEAPGEWGLVAETRLTLPEGRYRISLLVQADVQVSLYGSPVASRGWGPEPEQFDIEFRHSGGDLPIRIEAVDAGGPFRLAWR